VSVTVGLDPMWQAGQIRVRHQFVFPIFILHRSQISQRPEDSAIEFILKNCKKHYTYGASCRCKKSKAKIGYSEKGEK
jgi:hypothetical protein